jgi:hypothetical protein
MSAEIRLAPLNERGIKLLDQLEAKAALLPSRTDAQGARTYALSSGDAQGFEGLLDRIGGDWRAHLLRTS